MAVFEYPLLCAAKAFTFVLTTAPAGSTVSAKLMKPSLANLILAVAIAAVGVFSGLLLMSYSGADDAPGGVLLGILLVVGALATSVRTARRASDGSPARQTADERSIALEANVYAMQCQLDEVRGQLTQLEEKFAFTQSLLESRSSARPSIPTRA
jgi:hypothetical protein